MRETLAVGFLVAAVNVAASRWFQGRRRDGGRYWRAQLAGLVFRAGTIFGAATWAWSRSWPVSRVAAIIVVAATAQMIGQVYLTLRGERPYA